VSGAPGNEVDPFIALPFGWDFSEGQYKTVSTFTVGSFFKTTEHFRYVMEFGIAINHIDSYISAGVIYSH
jgi:hypothetical protein